MCLLYFYGVFYNIDYDTMVVVVVILLCACYISMVCFIILIGRAKRAPHWGVQSRFRMIYIYMYVHVSVVVQKA